MLITFSVNPIYASTFGHKEIVELLLSSGADKTLKDNREKTALDHATMQGNDEIIKLLNK